jgi:hypothetical protein
MNNHLARFIVFFDQNFDQSYSMRQQANGLIFLLVIEDIEVYHLGYLKVFALRKSRALPANPYTGHYLNIHSDSTPKPTLLDRKRHHYLKYQIHSYLCSRLKNERIDWSCITIFCA